MPGHEHVLLRRIIMAATGTSATERAAQALAAVYLEPGAMHSLYSV